MAKSSIGSMFHVVGFDKQGTASDGAGGTISTFVEQFTCRASFTHLRGGENVQAARLEGRHPQIVRVRSFENSRLVTTDWRITDKHTSEVFNIRDITPTEDRRYLEMLVEKGVAL